MNYFCTSGVFFSILLNEQTITNKVVLSAISLRILSLFTELPLLSARTKTATTIMILCFIISFFNENEIRTLIESKTFRVLICMVMFTNKSNETFVVLTFWCFLYIRKTASSEEYCLISVLTFLYWGLWYFHSVK